MRVGLNLDLNQTFLGAVILWALSVALVGRELAEAGDAPLSAVDGGDYAAAAVVGHGELPVLGGRADSAGHLADSAAQGLGPRFLADRNLSGWFIAGSDILKEFTSQHITISSQCIRTCLVRAANAGLPLVGRHRPQEPRKIAKELAELNASWRQPTGTTPKKRGR